MQDFSVTASVSLGTKLQLLHEARQERSTPTPRHRHFRAPPLGNIPRVGGVTTAAAPARSCLSPRQPRPHGGVGSIAVRAFSPPLRGLPRPAGGRFQPPSLHLPAWQPAEGRSGQPVPPAPATLPGRRCPRGQSAFRAGCRSPPGPAGPGARGPRVGSAACDTAGITRDTGALPAGSTVRPGTDLGVPWPGSPGPRCRPTHLGLARTALPGLQARPRKG